MFFATMIAATRRPPCRLLGGFSALIALLLLLPLLLILHRQAQAASPDFQTLEVKGLSRTYLLHVPTNYDASRAAPLVIVLHGATQGPSNVEK